MKHFDFKGWLQSNEAIIRRKFPQLITGFTDAANLEKKKKIKEEFNNPFAPNKALLQSNPAAPYSKPEKITEPELPDVISKVEKSLKVHRPMIFDAMNNNRVHPSGPFKELEKVYPNQLKVIKNLGDLDQVLNKLIQGAAQAQINLKQNPSPEYIQLVSDLANKVNSILEEYEKHLTDEKQIWNRNIKSILAFDKIALALQNY